MHTTFTARNFVQCNLCTGAQHLESCFASPKTVRLLSRRPVLTYPNLSFIAHTLITASFSSRPLLLCFPVVRHEFVVARLWACCLHTAVRLPRGGLSSTPPRRTHVRPPFQRALRASKIFANLLPIIQLLIRVQTGENRWRGLLLRSVSIRMPDHSLPPPAFLHQCARCSGCFLRRPSLSSRPRIFRVTCHGASVILHALVMVVRPHGTSSFARFVAIRRARVSEFASVC